MTFEIVFIIQLASIIAFIVSLFVLYRLLVHMKDATIQHLKEQVLFLKERLAAAENQDPDVLVERLTKRVKALENELDCLEGEKSTDEHQTATLKMQLEEARQDVLIVEPKIDRAQSMVRRFSLQQKARRSLVKMYGGKCQVCASGAPETIQIAHIVPVSQGGESNLGNLLCLCANHHILFDRGCFTIAPDLSLEGMAGRLNLNPEHRISLDALTYHRENVYRPNKAMD